MKIRLYHGTSDAGLIELLKSDRDRLYLTADSDQAAYYAECAAESDDSGERILVIEVDTANLRADQSSFNEPLTMARAHHGISSEDEWHARIASGTLPYPALDDWKTSLAGVRCVLHVGPIEPGAIFGGISADLDADLEPSYVQWLTADDGLLADVPYNEWPVQRRHSHTAPKESMS